MFNLRSRGLCAAFTALVLGRLAPRSSPFGRLWRVGVAVVAVAFALRLLWRALFR
jgi:hypothetical protein